MSMAAPALRVGRACALSGALLTAAVASAQPAADARAVTDPAAGAGEREAARASFERGLALARDGRYAEAKAAFLAAYAAHPHYLVLYNVAQAENRLGNVESAITYLERFLSEGGAAVSPEQKARVNDQLAELRGRSSSAAADLEPETPPARETLLPGAGVLVEQRPPASAPSTPVAAPLGVSAATPQASREPWGILLGVSGGVLLGVATGLYLWNDTRHGKWNEERQRLDALPNRDQLLRTDPALWQQAKSNNDLLGAIQRVDVAALVLGGVGAVALGAGVWSVLAQPAAREPALAASGTTLTWRTTW